MSDDVVSVMTPYSDVAELGQGYMQRADGERLWVPLAEPATEGTEVRFIVHLADGTPAFAGAGRCVQVADQGEAVDAVIRFEALLDSLQFDERSQPVYDYIVAVRSAALESVDASDQGEAAAEATDHSDASYADVHEAEVEAQPQDAVEAQPQDAVEAQPQDAVEAQPQDAVEDAHAGVREASEGGDDTAEFQSEEPPAFGGAGEPDLPLDSMDGVLDHDTRGQEAYGRPEPPATEILSAESEPAFPEPAETEPDLPVQQQATDDAAIQTDAPPDGAYGDSEGHKVAAAPEPGVDGETAGFVVSEHPPEPIPTGVLTRQAIATHWRPDPARKPSRQPANGLFRYAGESLPSPAAPPRPALDPSYVVQPAPHPGQSPSIAGIDAESVQPESAPPDDGGDAADAVDVGANAEISGDGNFEALAVRQRR